MVNRESIHVAYSTTLGNETQQNPSRAKGGRELRKTHAVFSISSCACQRVHTARRRDDVERDGIGFLSPGGGEGVRLLF